MVLTRLAALGLVVVMALAGTVHLRRWECSAIGMNGVLPALSVVVAWGRFGPYSFWPFPIHPRPAAAVGPPPMKGDDFP
ncbi:hypothetical protein ACIRJO_32020 [Streptomyces sp. NPDC102394]|uniref:hypothetical protein n=1 Tax=Streptomyces sp. NPDC102394 TaxID=3366167 RepID=UPI003821C885